MTLLAQGGQISITTGSATVCDGVIEDSGGPSGEYADNEDYTFTICPDVPGNVIYLTWFVFDLSTQGNPDDYMAIYDGDNTGATSLGQYTGTELQNLIVSGTVFNTTGCLTLVFHSNGTGTGNFSCGVQCTTPCEHPTAVASMSEPVPLLACVDEVITFDGSASYAAPGFNIQQYTWNFDDGTIDSTSGPVVTHSFASDGEYVVQLLVTDENDCSNLNLVDLQVLVSTTPNFALTSESVETCFGETVTLVGNAQPVTWTGLPDAGIGEPVLLPDDVGAPYTSGLVYEQFDPGQEMTGTGDLLSICVEMEHSFMGDLVLQLICPNGQTTILHQQGGGGVFIGDANDADGFDPEPGTCWTYCWSPTATNGTFVDNSTTNTVMASQGTALAPGTYEAVQPFDNLIGCPLNGEWVFQSTDLWGADNGFICNWTINWNPDIIPDLTTFTPSFGLDADSTFWTGEPGSTITSNGDTVTFTADEPGVYDFHYNVLDNFGCPYDTLITITINEPFTVDAGPDDVICNDPLQLEAVIVGGGGGCNWTLELNDASFNGWGASSLEVSINGVVTAYSCAGGSQTFNIPVMPGDEVILNYFAGFEEWDVSYALIDDQGNTVFDDGPWPVAGQVYTGAATCDGQDPMTWEWTPADGLSDPNIADPTVLVTSQTTFTVTAWPTGHPVCAASDEVTITLDPGLDPGTDSLVIVCATPPSFDLISMLGGTPNPGGIWTDANGNVVPDVFNPMVDPAGVYTYTVTTNLGCVGTANLEIQILDATDPQCCGVVDAGPDAIVCDLEYQLSASVGNTGMGIWSGPAGYVIDEPWNAQTEVNAPGSGPATFYWTEDDGVLCYLIDSVTITFTQPLEAVVSYTDAICFEACDGTASVAVTGGNGDFTYAWTDNLAGDTPEAEGICAGTYAVSITDENGCGTNDDFSIGQPPLLEIDGATFVEPWCGSGGIQL